MDVQESALGNCSLAPGGFPIRERLGTPILGEIFPHFGTKCAVNPKTGDPKKSQTLALEKSDLKSFSDFRKKISM
jgi:hypothetical protein